MVAPSVTTDTFSLDWHQFRSSAAEEKEIKTERKQKYININGYGVAFDEIQIAVDRPRNIRYIQPLFNIVEFINENAPGDLATQARPYINNLNERLAPFVIMGLPPFSVSLPEDETLLIEWDFEHFTIGLSFEPNSEDSSWYIVNDGRIRGTTGWGYLDSKPIDELVQNFIAEAIYSLNVT